MKWPLYQLTFQIYPIKIGSTNPRLVLIDRGERLSVPDKSVESVAVDYEVTAYQHINRIETNVLKLHRG